VGTVGGIEHTIVASLDATNINDVSGEVSTTNGEMVSGSMSAAFNPLNGVTSERTIERAYPYTVVSSYKQTAEDFEIFGLVDFAVQVSVNGSGGVPWAWELAMVSNATYNRTNDYVYNVETGVTDEQFVAAEANLGPCGEQALQALDGYVTGFAEQSSCVEGLRNALCVTFDVCAPTSANATAVPPPGLTVSSGGRSGRATGPLLLFRSPFRRVRDPTSPLPLAGGSV